MGEVVGEVGGEIVGASWACSDAVAAASVISSTFRIDDIMRLAIFRHSPYAGRGIMLCDAHRQLVIAASG